MTSVRAKRNSKVPNRFSSDNSQIETANANGETIIDYNNKTTSTTHNLVPINRTIKLKPAIREPLKVKLPKLKRLQSATDETKSSSKTNSTHKAKTDEIKIHKIKLPSLSKKSSSNKTSASPSSTSIKSDSPTSNNNNNNNTTSPINSKNNFINIDYDITKSQTVIAPKNMPNATLSSLTKSSIPYNINSKAPTGTSLLHKSSQKLDTHSRQTSASTSSNKLDISISSISTDSSIANSSFSSDDYNADGGGQMEIVVSQAEVVNNSGIKCPCGVDDDLGVMVECESCSTWQHGHCINLGTEEEAYEGYTCAFCNLPKDKARDSLLQLIVGDKFQARFNKVLEYLRKKQTADNRQQQDATSNTFYETTQTNEPHLTIEELSQAIKDLKRVMNSLRVKYLLYEKPTHDEELRIWQNCYWSEDQAIANKDKNLYIYDRCRSNLKLNIRNMLKKMDERCQLIEYVISTIESRGTQSKVNLDKLRESLQMIVYKVKEYKNRIKLTQSN